MRRTLEPVREMSEGVAAPAGAEAIATLAGESSRTAPLLALLLAEASVFALLTASGNIPEIVSTLFRALLTL